MSAVKLLASVGVAALAAGCALSPQARYTELAYDAATAIDMGQTVTIVRNPRAWEEGDDFTASVIGRHPAERSVYIYFATSMALHYCITAVIDHYDDGHGWVHAAASAWEGYTVGTEVKTVAHNFSNGDNPWMSAQKPMNELHLIHIHGMPRENQQ